VKPSSIFHRSHKFMTLQVNLDFHNNQHGSTSRLMIARAVAAVAGFLSMGQTKGLQLELATNVRQVKTFRRLPRVSSQIETFQMDGLMQGQGDKHGHT